ncbi:MAG: hypothetical protein EAZ62_04240 [Sphingobacteriia bacterium]|nr:MAG: hypothetical protein EAZ62_04240 [Sphingobacteriia bacterium]
MYPMERVGTLIQKLTEQYRSQAPAAELRQTALCLLQCMEGQAFTAVEVRGKVSVVLPSQQHRAPIASEPLQTTQALVPDETVAAVLASAFAAAEQPVEKLELPAAKPSFAPLEKAKAFHTDSQPKKEIYPLFAPEEEAHTEVLTLLEDSPIRDLRKAISLQERIKFVRDLFRDDDNMFERSIRTINGFNIYAEAQYWIQRELKVKLGWEDHPESARQFDHLVRRRFS